MASRREALRLLGVTPNATEAEVRAAFRKKVVEHHPDTAPQGTDASTVRHLIDAYHLLIDSLPPTDPDPPAVRQRAPGQGVTRVHVRDTTGSSQASTHPQRWCQECMATGLLSRFVTCRACQGGAILTTLDVGQVQVSRCRHCRGRGQVPSLEPCRACDGTGWARPEPT